MTNNGLAFDANYWQWTVTANNPFMSSYSLESDDIDDDMMTAVILWLGDAGLDKQHGTVYWMMRCSCEVGWDYAFFYKDFAEYLGFADEDVWHEFEAPVQNNANVGFFYFKDGYVSEGDDTCWIDNIRFEYLCNPGDGCYTSLACGNEDYDYYVNHVSTEDEGS